MSISATDTNAKDAPLIPVPYVDLERFMGDWYVLANIPTRIEKGAVNAIENYKLRDDGNIDITFTFRKDSPNGKVKDMKSRGIIVDKETNAEWKVRFFWILKFPYFVIDLDENYRYTTIGLPNRKHFWVMARTTELEEHEWESIRENLTEQGFDLSKMQMVPQIWENEEKVTTGEIPEL